MATSVVSERDKYSELFLRVARWAALLVPGMVALYGLLIGYGLMPHSPAYSPLGLVIVCLFFLVIAPIQFFDRHRTVRSLAIYLTIYHILGAAYLLFGAGFIGPLTMCWLILIIITDLLFGRRGVALSMALLVSVGLWTFAYEPTPTLGLFMQYLTFVTLTVIAGLIVSRLRRVQRVERSDFQRSKQQEELQRGQLMTLINSVGVAIVSTSSTGTIRIYNAAMLSLLDTNDSLSGKKIDDVFHLYDEAGEPISLVAQMKKSDKVIDRDDLSHRFNDGESIRLSVSCAPIRGHFSGRRVQHEGFIFIIRDISKAKSLELERNEFISVVSHELRTPITIAEGTISNLQLLLDRGMDPKQLAPALKEAHEQIIYLASMVNDLSTLSRAERGVADEPEEINVTEMLNEMYHRYQERAGRKKLTFNIDLGPRLGTIRSSRLYLEEVLQNLVTNSIKYTPAGSVTLSAKRVAGGIEFAIRDTGIGISKTDQKRIFQKFFRSEDYRTRETSGTGLGLYVVQKLSEKLGVHISVMSRLNHGSTFSFVLPPEPPADAGPKHSDA